MLILSYSLILAPVITDMSVVYQNKNSKHSRVTSMYWELSHSHMHIKSFYPIAILRCRSCCPRFAGEKTEVQTSTIKELVETRVSALTTLLLAWCSHVRC